MKHFAHLSHVTSQGNLSPQGILIFLMFDLRPKIYYMAFEKVTGKPHPALRSFLNSSIFSLTNH